MNCDFCDERQGLKTIYHKIYGPRDRTVYETRSFSVFPCMGQLRAGHLLISSKAHKNAIGMLDADAIRELEGLVAEIAGLFRDVYQKDLFCFEHGVLDDQGANGGCGIYHMHLHLIPAGRQEFSSILKLVQGNAGNIVRPAQGLADTRGCVSAQKTYIYLAFLGQTQTSDAFLVTSRDNYFESQYMRKAVCQVFGKADWDWRGNKEPEPALLNTLEKGYAYFHR